MYPAAPARTREQACLCVLTITPSQTCVLGFVVGILRLGIPSCQQSDMTPSTSSKTSQDEAARPA